MGFSQIRELLEDNIERDAETIAKSVDMPRKHVLDALRKMLAGGYVTKRLDESKKDRHGRPVAYFTAADPEDFPRQAVEEIIASAMSNRHPLERVWST